MCKEATIITRVTIDNKKPEEEEELIVDKIPIDEDSKMLCNVIVQATHELHFNQHKNRNDIQIFLKNDCQKLTTTELVEKVKQKNLFF
jgi:hypothetical protein